LLQSLTRGFEFNACEAFGLPPLQPHAGKTLAIHPTASTVVKYYPLEFWKALVNGLKDDFSKLRVFYGRGAEEAEFVKAIRENLAPSWAGRYELCANLGFKEVAASLQACDYFIGSDSALVHLAALFDKPLLGLRGFGDYRRIYPYGDNSSVYLPREVINTTDSEYPSTVPPYLKRANAESVIEIVRGTRKADFSIQPTLKKEVRFHVF
jgi:ADP-heptose:LPS heptosyltransferase